MKKVFFAAMCGVMLYAIFHTAAYQKETVNISSEEPAKYSVDPLDKEINKVLAGFDNQDDIIIIKGEEKYTEHKNCVRRECSVKFINEKTAEVETCNFAVLEQY